MAARYPDFIIVGAMKAGTSSLHDQLARRPGLFMSTPKEPNFFSDDAIFDRGLGWYADLFESAGARRCGESSTHYTKLPTYPKTVPRMRAALNRPRFVYLVRHPLDRIISHFIHEWSEGRTASSIEQAIRRDETYLAYSSYARQLKPYLEAFGPQHVLLVFFERMVSNPDAELRRICRFVGDRDWREARWEPRFVRSNTSSERLRKTFLRNVAVRWTPAKALRPWIPASLRRRVKRRWQMSERPTISRKTQRWIEDRIDADLEMLGGWLGLNLSCDSWRESALRDEPNWVDVS